MGAHVVVDPSRPRQNFGLGIESGVGPTGGEKVKGIGVFGKLESSLELRGMEDAIWTGKIQFWRG